MNTLAAEDGIRPVDAHTFSGDRIGAIRHGYHHHPLMRIDSLAALAHRLLPLQKCRFAVKPMVVGSVFEHTHRLPKEATLDSVFDRIEDSGSWIALYNVEVDPLYRVFLEEVIATARPMIEPTQAGVRDVGGFIFISAPPSVTPFHIDRENNFWLQISGRKSMYVWDRTDRVAVDERAVEDFIVHGVLDRVVYRDELLTRTHRFEVGPGDGVYFPSTSPHMTTTTADWVRPGDALSISIGVVFYTETTRRASGVYQCNLAMRRMGLKTRPPGASRMRDAIKAPIGRAIVRTRQVFNKYPAPPGTL